VLGHFFLFCNVFRISRPPELIWAVVLILLCIFRIYTGIISWQLVFLSSLFSSAILITREVQRPDYHGVGWKRFNPNLENWWNANFGREHV
jgi:hypothetical protein